MDIRDIKKVPTPQAGKTLEDIFNLQKNLLEEYKKIEKFRDWPWDIDLPEDQKDIKDFIARVVEELGEGYESYLKVVEAYYSGNLTPELLSNNLHNLNEEIADALHFIMEVFIVTGITHDILVHWGLSFIQPIHTIEDYGNLYSIFKTGSILNPTITKGIYQADLEGLGGLDISYAQLSVFSRGCWEVTYHLQLARNTLKNKPWKQTHMRSDQKVFLAKMAQAFHSFISLTRSLGIDEQGLYTLYYKKNMINHFRIKSKY